MSRIIALLTDFGLQDVYVGVMKGAIAYINSHIQIIDLTHNIPRQNVAAARFCLMNAVSFFPQETVYVAVVDPGVGSKRRGIAVKFAGGYLVGPDNGLFSGVLAFSSNKPPAITAVELTNPDYWRVSSPSFTFHGRDIFAPVGAHLASGVPLKALGKEIKPDSLVNLPIAESEFTDTGILGCIQYIDIFGNLITNIPAGAVAKKSWSVVVGELVIPSCQTYSDRPLGEVVTLVGSHGWVEIAVNSGNAQTRLKLDWGDEIKVVFEF